MCLSSPKMPAPPPPPPEVPTQSDASVTGARSREKKRLRAASGYAGTVLTGPMGDTSGGSIGKTILGG